MAVLILTIFAVIMLGGAAYSLNMARHVCCPACIHDGEENAMMPILGPFLWWCLSCDGKFSYQEAMRSQLYEEEEAEQRERLALPPGRDPARSDQDW